MANPGRIGTIRMTLNIIFVLIIITHARGFESIKIFGGEGDLAAPYFKWMIIEKQTKNYAKLKMGKIKDCVDCLVR